MMKEYGSNYQQVADVSESAAKTQQWGKWELQRLKVLAQENSGKTYKFKSLSLACAISMIASGIVGLFTEITRINLLAAFVEVYIFGFGIIMLTVDASDLLCPSNRKKWVTEYVFFITTLWGKGAFYLFAGALMMAQWSSELMIVVLLGALVFLLGCFMLYSGYSAQDKLSQLQSTLSSEDVLLKKFEEFDEDKNGALDKKELVRLCKSLGSNLTTAELESFVLLMDTNNNGRVEYGEFLAWWKGNSAPSEV